MFLWQYYLFIFFPVFISKSVLLTLSFSFLSSVSISFVSIINTIPSTYARMLDKPYMFCSYIVGCRLLAALYYSFQINVENSRDSISPYLRSVLKADTNVTIKNGSQMLKAEEFLITFLEYLKTLCIKSEQERNNSCNRFVSNKNFYNISFDNDLL